MLMTSIQTTLFNFAFTGVLSGGGYGRCEPVAPPFKSADAEAQALLRRTPSYAGELRHILKDRSRSSEAMD
jgi:hypothetical protein